MAKVKLTKTALKQQRDDLKQFQRFLPTLQLKKQQLQMEMRSCLERIRSNEVREKSAPLIQQDLKNIGISVEILTTDHPTLLAECRNGNYDFALIGSGGSP